MGCFADDKVSRTMTRILEKSILTYQQCRLAAAAGGWAYFGQQSGTQCYGSNSTEFARLGSSDSCTMGCSGRASQGCGGNSSNAVFLTTASGGQLLRGPMHICSKRSCMYVFD